MSVCACFLAASTLVFASQASAQVAAVVGPRGALITIALSNDGQAPFSYLPPGATFVGEWPQIDRSGREVSAWELLGRRGSAAVPGSGVASFSVVLGGGDAAGRATSPLLALPRMNSLVGVPFYLDFAALDPAAPGPIARLSAPLAVTRVEKSAEERDEECDEEEEQQLRCARAIDSGEELRVGSRSSADDGP